MEIILSYFDDLTSIQIEQLQSLQQVYTEWNEKINVISRKDIDSLYVRHVLHSLAIATTFDFKPGQRIIDIGTGGGFPGIPLAIFFPEVEFVLADSIQKKLTVVNEVANHCQLKNVQTHWGRVEQITPKNSFDFAVSRAVAPLGDLWRWAKPLLRKGIASKYDNGLICLKGGDLNMEISHSGCRPLIWHIYEIFQDDLFKEKYMLYVKK